MQILIDDQAYAMTGPATQSVGELANEVCKSSQSGEARFVIGLRCNGQSIPQDQLATVLATPAGQFDRLEFQTQPVAALVRSTLEQALLVIEDSTLAREKAADLLAEGQNAAAMQELQKFLEAWKQIQQTLMVVSSVLHIDLDACSAGETRLTAVLESLKTQFGELRNAMAQGDFVVVGDVLRYELAEPMSQLVACFRQLRDQ